MNFRLINQSLVVNTRVRRTAGCVSMLSALRAISRKTLSRHPFRPPPGGRELRPLLENLLKIEPLWPASTLGSHSSNPKRSDTNPFLGSGCSGQKSGRPFPLPPNLEGPCLFPVTGR
jgi:hypothetical protein